MGRTSAEYGVWFAISSIGYMAGNFVASRLSTRYGIDTTDLVGHRLRGRWASRWRPCWRLFAHALGPGHRVRAAD